MLLLKQIGRNVKTKQAGGSMDELEVEENPPSIPVMPNLACKKPPLMPDEQPTYDSTETNSNAGINKSWCRTENWVRINKKQLTFIEFPSAPLPVMIVTV